MSLNDPQWGKRGGGGGGNGGPPDLDEIWRNVDRQRAELADLFEALTPQQWASPSLWCPSGSAVPR